MITAPRREQWPVQAVGVKTGKYRTFVQRPSRYIVTNAITRYQYGALRPEVTNFVE